MIIYFEMIFFSLLFGFIATGLKINYEKNKNPQNKLFFIICVIISSLPTILVSGFRDIQIGTDTSGTYYQIYNIISNGGSIRDFGYGFLNKICIYFGSNYNGILIVNALIFSGLAYYTIFKESKRPIMSILLLFTTNVFFISMNMTRQCIATAIFIFSMQFIKKRKPIKYFICCFLAFSMHSSSIIYVPMYFIFNIKIKRNNLIKLIVIFMSFTTIISTLLVKVLVKFKYFNKYFSWYLTSIYNNGRINIISLTIAVLIFIYLLLIYKNAKEDKDYYLLLWSQTFAIFALFLSGKIPLMQRISWMFTFPLFVYLPNTFGYLKSKNNRLIFEWGINLGYALYMFVTIFVLKYNEVVPYYSIF